MDLVLNQNMLVSIILFAALYLPRRKEQLHVDIISIFWSKETTLVSDHEAESRAEKKNGKTKRPLGN